MTEEAEIERNVLRDQIADGDEVAQTPKNELEPCPCGEVPAELNLEVGQRAKYGRVVGSCCGEWSIEFRNGYTTDMAVTVQRAQKAWNDAPRSAGSKPETSA